ncbi:MULTISPECIES: hypothetical protein, partial [unclassified Desulfovibrio]|uniref:hypothetical protein n=1 Tax=unclassified Desulfovibrio TaxID=2593640 RepID=UPI001C8904BC
LPTRQAVGGFHPQSPALAVSDTTGFSRWSIHFLAKIARAWRKTGVFAMNKPETLTRQLGRTIRAKRRTLGLTQE